MIPFFRMPAKDLVCQPTDRVLEGFECSFRK
jgi:hypothetical protein